MVAVVVGSTTRPSAAILAAISGGISASAGRAVKPHRLATAAMTKRRWIMGDIVLPPTRFFGRATFADEWHRIEAPHRSLRAPGGDRTGQADFRILISIRRRSLTSP